MGRQGPVKLQLRGCHNGVADVGCQDTRARYLSRMPGLAPRLGHLGVVILAPTSNATLQIRRCLLFWCCRVAAEKHGQVIVLVSAGFDLVECKEREDREE